MLDFNIKKRRTHILYSAFESARPIRLARLERTTYEKRERVFRALLEKKEKERVKVSDDSKKKIKR